MPMHMQVDSEIKGSFPTQSNSFLKYKKKTLGAVVQTHYLDF